MYLNCESCAYALKINLKVKFQVTKMKPIYDFQLMYNSNCAPNL